MEEDEEEEQEGKENKGDVVEEEEEGDGCKVFNQDVKVGSLLITGADDCVRSQEVQHAGMRVKGVGSLFYAYNMT